MAGPKYEEMGSEETGEDDPEGTEETAAEDPADDDEFMMAAEEAGFTGEKAKAFWRAVARCVELTKDGGGLPPLDEEALG